jgi:hypothetical protein
VKNEREDTPMFLERLKGKMKKKKKDPILRVALEMKRSAR